MGPSGRLTRLREELGTDDHDFESFKRRLLSQMRGQLHETERGRRREEELQLVQSAIEGDTGAFAEAI